MTLTTETDKILDNVLEQDILQYLYTHFESLIKNGFSVKDATDIVNELVIRDNLLGEIWACKGNWVLSNIFAEGARSRREVAREYVVNKSVEMDESKIFGQRRVDLSELRKPGAIFDALMNIGFNQCVRYGDMTREHWEFKQGQYQKSAVNAYTRYVASGKIKERIEPGKTTEECLTEEQFVELIPEIGF